MKRMLCVAPLSASLVSANVYAQECPNIIFILADDLGYGDLSYLNGHGKISTPNIDRLGQEGASFRNAHSSSAVSTPSRYGVLTGRYNWRSRLKNSVLGFYDNNGPLIPVNRTTMASMLRNQGYNTACIGKWHLGMNFPTTDGKAPVDNETSCNLDFNKEITGGPCDVGFDYFFGVDCPNYPPYCFIENRNTVGIPTRYYPPRKKLECRPGRGLENWNLEEVLPIITDKAVNYIKDASKKKEPFFLYFPLTSPHTPIVPTKVFKGKSGLNLYADFVHQTDATVGAILKAVKKEGIDKNTLIVFTSDNGCSPVADFNYLKQKGHNPSYIYRGAKSDLYEGGHRIPCLVRWPGRIAAHTINQTICLTDFMASFAHLTGYQLADDEAEDSYNILPLLLQKKEGAIIRQATVHHSIRGCFAIRQGKWKLLLSNNSGGWGFPSREQAYDLPYQLYDLEKDPAETTNVYEANKEKAEELRQLLISYVKNGRSTPGLPQENDPLLKGVKWVQLTPWME